LPVLGDEPFWVINADIYTDMALTDIDLAPDCLAHLWLVPMPDYKSGGDFALEDGLVRNAAPCDLTFSGMAVYRPAFFRDAPRGRFSVVPLLREAADSGQVSGSVYEGLWHDVGTPERLAELNH